MSNNDNYYYYPPSTTYNSNYAQQWSNWAQSQAGAYAAQNYLRTAAGYPQNPSYSPHVAPPPTAAQSAAHPNSSHSSSPHSKSGQTNNVNLKSANSKSASANSPHSGSTHVSTTHPGSAQPSSSHPGSTHSNSPRSNSAFSSSTHSGNARSTSSFSNNSHSNTGSHALNPYSQSTNSSAYSNSSSGRTDPHSRNSDNQLASLRTQAHYYSQNFNNRNMYNNLNTSRFGNRNYQGNYMSPHSMNSHNMSLHNMSSHNMSSHNMNSHNMNSHNMNSHNQYLRGRPYKRPRDSQEAIDHRGKSKNKKKKSLSENTPKLRDWSLEDAQKALQVEKDFNKIYKNHSLIIKFPDPELNKDIVAKFHPEIENVHFQQPSTARFCFVTLAKNCDAEKVITALNKVKFGEGYLVAEYKKDRDEDQVIGPEDIDPFTLYVGNLAQEVTKEDMVTTFPKCKRIDIGYAKKMKYTRYAFVAFRKVEEAIEAFTTTRCKEMHSKSLIVRFRRLKGTVGMPGETKPQNPPKKPEDTSLANMDDSVSSVSTDLHWPQTLLDMSYNQTDESFGQDEPDEDFYMNNKNWLQGNIETDLTEDILNNSRKQGTKTPVPLLQPKQEPGVFEESDVLKESGEEKESGKRKEIGERKECGMMRESGEIKESVVPKEFKEGTDTIEGICRGKGGDVQQAGLTKRPESTQKTTATQRFEISQGSSVTQGSGVSGNILPLSMTIKTEPLDDYPKPLEDVKPDLKDVKVFSDATGTSLDRLDDMLDKHKPKLEIKEEPESVPDHFKPSDLNRIPSSSNSLPPNPYICSLESSTCPTSNNPGSASKDSPIANNNLLIANNDLSISNNSSLNNTPSSSTNLPSNSSDCPASSSNYPASTNCSKPPSGSVSNTKLFNTPSSVVSSSAPSPEKPNISMDKSDLLPEASESRFLENVSVKQEPEEEIEYNELDDEDMDEIFYNSQFHAKSLGIPNFRKTSR